MGPDVPSGLRVPEYVEKRYLPQTRLLDFGSPGIHDLVAARGWGALEPFDQIGKAYTFVRDEVAFGYNRDDEIAASEVLKDGYGQCNTKGTLLMALLRALGIACRLHGFTIHKELQRGVVPELVYGLAPDDILHSWVEVWHDGRWINLEGFILDQPFLRSLQAKFAGTANELCGYGAGTDCLSSPPIDWVGQDTYIQRTGINADLGVFDSPDDFYARHKQNLGWMRGLLYRHLVRHSMNRRVRKVRQGRIPAIPGGPAGHEHVGRD